MNFIQRYFRYRQSLIDQYLKGDMSKREYLQRNYDAVLDLNIRPFHRIDSMEKGLFNYQYYNALAKQMKSLSQEHKIDVHIKNEYLEKSNYYYHKKDKATLGLLRFLDYRGIEAYFIKVQSKHLKGKLFEIVLSDDQTILHSTNTLILKELREEGVFAEECKRSLIDGYINQKY